MHKTDTNHREIINALRGVGATVTDLSAVGGGCPDILVGYHGRNYLLELKFDRVRMTERQLQWHGAWRGAVAIVLTVDEALTVIGAAQ